jgi:LmbE family N-acetylglucosaminyl deacetylase
MGGGTRRCTSLLCVQRRRPWARRWIEESDVQGAPGDLAALRGAELASAADVLGPFRAEMLDGPDGELRRLDQTRLVAEVVAAAESCLPEGLLVFDTTEATGHVDHVVASSAAQLAARNPL